jgi:hypothetical protein
VLGEALAAELGTSAIVGNALASTALQVASGKDLETALKGSITNAVASGATAAVAGEISDAAKSLDFDPKSALVGAAGAAILAGVKTTLSGGSTSDIARNMVAGAAGGATAAETGSLAAGGAVSGALTGGTTGALTGAASGLGQTAAAQAAQARSLGIPLPPGGKVGVTWSVDSYGNALVMYEDGTTGRTTVPAGTKVGSTISVDPGTNVAQVTSMAPVAVGGEQVAGPGGMSVQTVASMPEMQPRQGETAGDVTESKDADGITSYKRTIISTLPDGTKTSYEIVYDPGAESGKQITYETASVPKGEGGAFPTEGGGAVTVQSSYTRPGTEVGGGETTPEGAITGGKTADEIVYPNIIDPSAGYTYKIGQGLDVGVTGGGVTGGLPTTGGALPSTQENVIPEQNTQVSQPGAGTVTFGGQPGVTVDEFGIPIGGPIARGPSGGGGGAGAVPGGAISSGGEFGGEGPGAIGGGTSLAGGGGEGGGGGGGGGGGEELPPTEEPIPEEVKPGTVQQPYLVTAGISPQPKPRSTRALSTALQTPFERSLITSGLTSYRGAGEIESPESGKKRSNVWNEASLRLKDALGI